MKTNRKMTKIQKKGKTKNNEKQKQKTKKNKQTKDKNKTKQPKITTKVQSTDLICYLVSFEYFLGKPFTNHFTNYQ